MDAAPVEPSASLPKLYPLQAEGVLRFFRSAGTTVPPDGPHRFILGWATGCGKTAGALSAVQRLLCAHAKRCDEDPEVSFGFAPSVLVVTPAVVRRHWVREVETWAPSYKGHAAAIEYGRHRVLPGAVGKQRAWAYRQPMQVVSYDLLKEVSATGWHLIILDELHHVAQPLSKQSKLVRALLQANPDAHVLGLTATPFPTEVKQLWNPLRLLYGEKDWGKPSRTGDVSWDFARRYCNVEKGDYGTAISGCRVDRREELRGRLSVYIHFLTREDLRDDLPPLDVQLLELDAKRSLVKRDDTLLLAMSCWVRDKLAEGVRRVVVLTRTRDDGRSLFAELCDRPNGAHMRYLDGAVETQRRHDILQELEAARTASVLVGTHGALAEGVRLMWAEEVAIVDWPRSPGRMVQLLGRFQSVGSAARPHVSLITSEEKWGASVTLLERVRTMLAVTGASPSAEKLEALLSEPHSEDVGALLADMLSQTRDTETWLDDAS